VKTHGIPGKLEIRHGHDAAIQKLIDLLAA